VLHDPLLALEVNQHRLDLVVVFAKQHVIDVAAHVVVHLHPEHAPHRACDLSWRCRWCRCCRRRRRGGRGRGEDHAELGAIGGGEDDEARGI